jgi:hypothetical protein
LASSLDFEEKLTHRCIGLNKKSVKNKKTNALFFQSTIQKMIKAKCTKMRIGKPNESKLKTDITFGGIKAFKVVPSKSATTKK